MNLRPIRWPDDAPGLQGFDASYSTSTIFVADVVDMSVALRETRLAVPFRKTYAPETLVEAAVAAAFAVAAESTGGALEGFATVQLQRWNNSAELSALFVAPGSRGRGLGRALLAAALDFARSERVRCLTLETQTSNVPAIRFYQRMGFRFCGIHTALYDPAAVAPEEVAVFFAYALDVP